MAVEKPVYILELECFHVARSPQRIIEMNHQFYITGSDSLLCGIPLSIKNSLQDRSRKKELTLTGAFLTHR
jgi:hypothetical protein